MPEVLSRVVEEGEGQSKSAILTFLSLSYSTPAASVILLLLLLLLRSIPLFPFMPHPQLFRLRIEYLGKDKAKKKRSNTCTEYASLLLHTSTWKVLTNLSLGCHKLPTYPAASYYHNFAPCDKCKAVITYGVMM